MNTKHFALHPPYDSDEPCPHCGRNKVRMLWHKGDKRYVKNWCLKCKKKNNDRHRASMRFMGNKMFNGTDKECNKCHQIFPRTEEYWSKSACSPDRLQRCCKLCLGVRYYGLDSSIERENIREYQKNKCPFCPEGVDLPENGKSKLDHDYSIIPFAMTSGGEKQTDWITYPRELRRSSLRGLLCNKHNGEIAAVDKYFYSLEFHAKYDAYIADPPAQHVLAREVYN